MEPYLIVVAHWNYLNQLLACFVLSAGAEFCRTDRLMDCGFFMNPSLDLPADAGHSTAPVFPLPRAWRNERT